MAIFQTNQRWINPKKSIKLCNLFAPWKRFSYSIVNENILYLTPTTALRNLHVLVRGSFVPSRYTYVYMYMKIMNKSLVKTFDGTSTKGNKSINKNIELKEFC